MGMLFGFHLQNKMTIGCHPIRLSNSQIAKSRLWPLAVTQSPN